VDNEPVSHEGVVTRRQVIDRARELTAVDVDDLVVRYAAGEPANGLARAYGTTPGRIRRVLTRAGVILRGKAEAWRALPRPVFEAYQRARTEAVREARGVSVDIQECVTRYAAGNSLETIARALRVSPHTVRLRLERAGVPVRSGAETLRLRLSRLSFEERRALAARSLRNWEGVRGHRKSDAQLGPRTLTRQRLRSHTGDGEGAIAGWLRALGLEPTQQQAVGRYNLDLGLWPLAIEVNRVDHPLRRVHAARRLEYLTQRGWYVLFVWLGRSGRPTPAVADYAVAYLQAIQRNPTGVGQYRVIRGTGDLVASGRPDFD
jgi:very-short-patch-repair endonuclease